MLTDKELIERLEEYKKKHGLSWQDILDRLGIARQTLSNWRNETTEIRPKFRRAIATLVREDQEPISDAILQRLVELYTSLGGEGRALLLANAERLASGARERTTTVDISTLRPGESQSVDPKKLTDCVDNPTTTPRGKTSGGILRLEVRCPNPQCQGIFYIPQLSAGRTRACPYCGQHVKVEGRGK